jgi:hypothetical protein
MAAASAVVPAASLRNAGVLFVFMEPPVLFETKQIL